VSLSYFLCKWPSAIKTAPVPSQTQWRTGLAPAPHSFTGIVHFFDALRIARYSIFTIASSAQNVERFFVAFLSRGLEFVNRSKRLSRLKAAESTAYLKVFSAIPAACPQLPIFTYISPDCLRTLILPLAFAGCIYSSFSLSFGIHTEVFYIVVNVKHWESPGKAGGLPFKLSDSTAFVVYMARRISGGYLKNSLRSSQ